MEIRTVFLKFAWLLALFFCTSTLSAQQDSSAYKPWYTVKYGVSVLEELSIEKLREEQALCRDNRIVGIGMAVTGGVAFVSGVAIALNNMSPFQEDEGMEEGELLSLLGVGLVLTGIITSSVNGHKLRQVNRAIRALNVSAGTLKSHNTDRYFSCQLGISLSI